jgi:uncharacterized membrane protein YgaE (UPF0421/DUF939 family)
MTKFTVTDEMFMDLNLLLNDSKFSHKNNEQLAKIMSTKHVGIKAEHIHLIKEDLSDLYQHDLELEHRKQLYNIVQDEDIYEAFLENNLIPQI